QVEEEGLDHVLRNQAYGQLREVTTFDLQRVVEVNLRTFHGRAQDVARSRVVGAFQLLLQVGRESRQVHGQGRGGRRAARDLVALHVPRLLRGRVGLDPRLGF